MDNLWNFLFFTGYLTKTGQSFHDDEVYVSLRIPNKEVLQIYKSKVTGWFRDEVGQRDLGALYQGMLEGDAAGFQAGLAGLLQDTVSFYDNAEAFYHGFMVGVLGQLKTHIIRSNRESGDGRYDILVRSPDVGQPVVVMELKAAKDYASLQKVAAIGLGQIEKNGYDRELAGEGYKKSIRYGIAFYKKNCKVEKQEIDL